MIKDEARAFEPPPGTHCQCTRRWRVVLATCQDVSFHGLGVEAVTVVWSGTVIWAE